MNLNTRLERLEAQIKPALMDAEPELWLMALLSLATDAELEEVAAQDDPPTPAQEQRQLDILTACEQRTQGHLPQMIAAMRARRLCGLTDLSDEELDRIMNAGEEGHNHEETR